MKVSLKNLMNNSLIEKGERRVQDLTFSNLKAEINCHILIK